MDRILIILKKENGPRASSALTLGLNTIILKHVYWYTYMQQISGERLQDHWSSPSRHLTSVGRQIDVRLRRHNDVGFRLILKVCLTSKTDVILTSKTDVILTSEKQRWFDVSNVTS